MRVSPTLPSQLACLRFSASPSIRIIIFSVSRFARGLPRRKVPSRSYLSTRVSCQNSPTTNRGYQSTCAAWNISINRRSFSHTTNSPVRSSVSLGLFCIFGAGLGLGFTLVYFVQSKKIRSTSLESLEDFTEDFEKMSTEIHPGRPGNLTAEQEEKLRQLWQLIFQVCGIAIEHPSDEPVKAEETATSETSKKAKKSRMGFLRRGKKDTDAHSASEAEKGPAHPVILGNHGDEDKHGQVKHFYDTLSSQSPEFIRQTIWSMVKHDHPDALALRFLRARKWDVEKALIMFISTINWRATDMKVDDDIMKNGEVAALAAESGSDGPAKTLGHDFLEQMRMGKSYLHGCDKQGRPICVVRVRLHKAGEQIEESLERYTVYLIETTRMLLNPPVDTATILFDMSGFSMANMDYTPVKFMIKCFEANYPESLGTVLVHNAPWIFQGIWRVIKGWLDPVVASKINFTNNAKDLEGFIDRSRIPKELDGDEDWTYQYIESVPGENDKMNDTATRDRLIAAREALYKEYEDATIEWIHNPQSAEIKARRNDIAARLKQDYWVLDPYIRARSLYDRIGILQPGGKVDYYPPASIASAAKAAASTTATEAVVAEKMASPVTAPAPVPVAVAVADDDID